MEDKTRLEQQEIALQFENSLRLHGQKIASLTASSVRGMVTLDELVIHSFTSYLETLSEMMKAYPDGLDKARLTQQLINLHHSFSLAGYEKHISNYKQLENHYLQKYNQMNSVLSAICSIALDNPDEDAYKIIADYKTASRNFLLAFFYATVISPSGSLTKLGLSASSPLALMKYQPLPLLMNSLETMLPRSLVI